MSIAMGCYDCCIVTVIVTVMLSYHCNGLLWLLYCHSDRYCHVIISLQWVVMTVVLSQWSLLGCYHFIAMGCYDCCIVTVIVTVMLSFHCNGLLWLLYCHSDHYCHVIISLQWVVMTVVLSQWSLLSCYHFIAMGCYDCCIVTVIITVMLSFHCNGLLWLLYCHSDRYCHVIISLQWVVMTVVLSQWSLLSCYHFIAMGCYDCCIVTVIVTVMLSFHCNGLLWLLYCHSDHYCHVIISLQWVVMTVVLSQWSLLGCYHFIAMGCYDCCIVTVIVTVMLSFQCMCRGLRETPNNANSHPSKAFSQWSQWMVNAI